MTGLAGCLGQRRGRGEMVIVEEAWEAIGRDVVGDIGLFVSFVSAVVASEIVSRLSQVTLPHPLDITFY